MKKIILSLASAVLLTVAGFSQSGHNAANGLQPATGGGHIHAPHTCNLVEVPLTTRVNSSSIIVEGRVVDKVSFWDSNNHNIYTSNKIEVFKVLKGNLSVQFVEMITVGGTVGLDMQVTEPSLQVTKNEVGVFLLKPNAVAVGNNGFNTVFKGQPVAGSQGLIEYDEIEGTAHDHFHHYDDVIRDVHDEIELITAQSPTVMTSYDLDTRSNSFVRGGVLVNSFTPTTVTAGTATTITISGAGFGASAGTVGFSDANDGGATFFDVLGTQIISWSDTQIVVEVPDRAGTGVFRVTTSGSGTGNSASSLTVSYAQLNVESDAISSGTDVAYPVQHVNENGAGGYTWQKFTDFANNASASASFDRALDSWVCSSGINWTVGATTTTDVVASDGINIVRFDNGSELPNGVLGRCTSRYSGCFAGGGSTLNWYVTELDIVFDDGTNWNFGPASPAFTEYDFESVTVHELGHGHQEGHVINTNEVMHFSISNGEEQRTLSANDIANGANVMVRNTGTSVCSETSMTALSCGVAPVADFSASATTVCAGSSVTFTDLSTGTPTSWSWDFGDGGTSTLQNPSHTYALAGLYTVVLTATNATGSDGETKTNFITVNALPTVSNTSSSDETCAGNDGTATITPTGTNPFTYLWTGGQTGQTATGLTAGTYNVVVTDANLCTNNTDVVVNDGCGGAAPVADFTANATTACANSSITFTDASTNTPTSWAWDFGDGGTSTSQNPSHTYTLAGSYTVVLTATNAFGSDGETKTNFITINALPTVSNTSSTDETCAGNDGTATITPTGTNPFTYMWTGGQTGQTATGLTAGTYNVVVTDANLCTNNTDVVVNDGCGVGTTQVTASDCNTAITMNYLFDCDAVSGATNYQWRFENGGNVIEKFRNNGNTNMWMNAVGGIQFATTYNVSVRAQVGGVWGTYGAVCTLTTEAGGIGTTQLSPGSCNITLTSLSTWIYCDPVVGATDYEFRFTRQATGVAVTALRGSNNANINTGAGALGLINNEVYDVEVRAHVGTGVGAYSTICTIATPTVATTNLTASFCNTTIPSYASLFTCDAFAGATNYQWRFVSQVDGTVIKRLRGNANTNMWFNKVGSTLIQTNTTYDVAVRAFSNGTWTVWGSVCPITSPATTSFTGNGSNAMAANNSATSSNFGEFTESLQGIAYPNPSNGNNVTLRLEQLNPDVLTTEVRMFDIYGKQVYGAVIPTSDSTLEQQITFDQPLPAGLYLISIRNGDQQQTIKWIVK